MPSGTTLQEQRAERPARKVSDREFIAMLAIISALEALAIDLMLPAFSDVRTHFGLASDSAATARIITFFFLGFAAQVVFGPIADRYGRLPVMRTGFVLYAIGSVTTAFAPTLGLMLAARLVWGVGAGALQVAAISMIRDRFVGDRMARVLSFFLVVFLTIPILAPALGELILQVSSWRVVFLGPLVCAAAVALWSRRLDESLPREARDRASGVRSLVLSARAVFTNSQTMRSIAAHTLTFAAFSSYLASSERIVGEIYGRGEFFALIFGGTSILMGVLSLLNARVVSRIGTRRAASLILVATSLTATAVLAFAVTNGGVPPFLVYLSGFSLVVGLNGMVSPNFGAMALEPQGDRAGMATAIYGSTQIAFGAIGGALIDSWTDTTVTPLIAAFLVAAILSLALVGPRPRSGLTPGDA